MPFHNIMYVVLKSESIEIEPALTPKLTDRDFKLKEKHCKQLKVRNVYEDVKGLFTLLIFVNTGPYFQF